MSKFNMSLYINMFKCKLVKFNDMRGWSVIATEDIKREDHVMGIPVIDITTFDYFPWQNVFRIPKA